MAEVVLNTGDTAWVLASTALVLLMTPGLALFYGGMVRAKSVLNMMLMSMVTLTDWFNKNKNRRQILLLALENIDNPHNLGAIIRTASHFAVDAIFYTSKNTSHYDPAVTRVAQGATEYVPLFQLRSWDQLLNFCQTQKITIYATSDKASEALNPETFLAKSMIVLGNEGKGLSSYWSSVSSHNVTITGTNKVESLNISVANGILLSFYRIKYH